MARVETIVVGGGIAATAPFTVNTLQMVVASSPPAISDSVFKQSANARSLAMGSGAAFGSGNDQIVIGSNSTIGTTVIGGVLIGAGITHSSTVGNRPPVAISSCASAQTGVPADCVIVLCDANAHSWSNAGGSIVIGGVTGDIGNSNTQIGIGQTVTTNQASNTLIGNGISCSSASTGQNVMIGHQAQGIAVGQSVIIGRGANGGSTVGGSTGAIIIGESAQVQNGNTHNIVIGRQASAGASLTSACIILGAGTTQNDAALSGAFVVGGPSGPISKFWVGRGVSHTASLGGLTLNCTNGITTNNLAMGDLTVIAPLGTGNATPGVINLQTGVIQAAGNTSQAARTGVRVSASTTADDTDLMVFDVTGAVLSRVSRGAIDSGGVGFRLLRIPN